ncbi:conserved hypothetical protein, partial [Ixodes scapularis]
VRHRKAPCVRPANVFPGRHPTRNAKTRDTPEARRRVRRCYTQGAQVFRRRSTHTRTTQSRGREREKKKEGMRKKTRKRKEPPASKQNTERAKKTKCANERNSRRTDVARKTMRATERMRTLSHSVSDYRTRRRRQRRRGARPVE